MNPKTLAPGSVLLIGALSLSVGWIAGRSITVSQSSPDAPTARQRAAARPAGPADDVAPFTGQLRKRLEAQPTHPPATGRNPFQFGARRAPGIVRSREPEAAPAPPPEPMVFTPPAPQFRLSGIASSQEGGGLVLTAIINDHGGLVFAKTGDKLSNGATLVSISETAVVITDVAGVSQILRLP